MNPARVTLLTLLENAKMVMRENNNVLFPICVPVTETMLLDPIPLTFSNDIEKLKTFFAVGIYCGERDCDAVILGLSCCSRNIDPKNSLYFFNNLETERPTLYPRNLRNNYIILQYVDFFNYKENEMLLCKFSVENNETNYFLPRFFGALDSVIVSMVLDGWDSVQDDDKEEY